MRVRVWVETTVMRRGGWVGGTVNRSILREVVEDGCDPSVIRVCGCMLQCHGLVGGGG